MIQTRVRLAIPIEMPIAIPAAPGRSAFGFAFPPLVFASR